MLVLYWCSYLVVSGSFLFGDGGSGGVGVTWLSVILDFRFSLGGLLCLMME